MIFFILTPSILFAGEGNVILLGFLNLIYAFSAFIAMGILPFVSIHWYIRNKNEHSFLVFFKSRIFLLFLGFIVGSLFLSFIGINILFWILFSINSQNPSVVLILAVWFILNVLTYNISLTPAFYSLKQGESASQKTKILTRIFIRIALIPVAIVAIWFLIFFLLYIAGF